MPSAAVIAIPIRKGVNQDAKAHVVDDGGRDVGRVQRSFLR
jgi:hypothetical protein